MKNLKIDSVSNNEFIPIQQKPKIDYKSKFSKALENLKNGKPADYDEEEMKGQKTQTMTQIMSDGSVLVTVYDEQGHIISQNKTRSANPDQNAHVIGTEVETKDFGLDELTMEGNINLINLQ